MGAPIDLIKRMIAAGMADEDVQAVIDGWGQPIPEIDPKANKKAYDRAYQKAKRERDRTTSHDIVEQRKVSPDPSKEITIPSSSEDKSSSEEAPLTEVFPTRKDLEEAVSEWNDLAEMRGLPKVRSLDANRRKSLTARLRELGSLDEWVEVLVKVRDSPFCCGDTGWRANFDFMLRKSSITKILEGNYDGQTQGQNSFAARG